MASANGSNRPPSGCISIPVEIIREPKPTGSDSHSRHNSPFRTAFNDNLQSGFPEPHSWSSNSANRFQPRQMPNAQFNQPFDDYPSFPTFQEPRYRQPFQQRMYEPGSTHFSRSSEDLISPSNDSTRYTAQPQFTSFAPPPFGSEFQNDSDFFQPSKFSNNFRRSYDALNDFPDMRQSFPINQQYPYEQSPQQPYYRTTFQTQHQPQQQPQHPPQYQAQNPPQYPPQRQPQQPQQQQQPTYANSTFINPNIIYTDEYGTPMDRREANTSQSMGNKPTNERGRSPASQRGTSPLKTQPIPVQQQDEPELKMAKDTDGPIPMPAPASYPSTTQSTDQQVPSTDSTTSTNVPSPPSQPARDPDTIALEKLEQLKQKLNVLENQVDMFTGSTRNDRAYKLLDEQALKIMIGCDELVDVSSDIKEKRKEMIRNVQRVLGKLESKVPATPAVEQNSNPMETATTSSDSSLGNTTSNIINNQQENVVQAPSTASVLSRENTDLTAAATELSTST